MIQLYPSTSSFLCPVSTELSLSMYQYPSPGLSQEGLLGFGRWLWRHSVGFFLHISYSLNKVHMAPKRELVDLQQEKRHFDWSLSAPWPYLTPRVFLFVPHQGRVPFSDLDGQQLQAAGLGGGKASVSCYCFFLLPFPFPHHTWTQIEVADEGNECRSMPFALPEMSINTIGPHAGSVASSSHFTAKHYTNCGRKGCSGFFRQHLFSSCPPILRNVDRWRK